MSLPKQSPDPHLAKSQPKSDEIQEPILMYTSEALRLALGAYQNNCNSRNGPQIPPQTCILIELTLIVVRDLPRKVEIQSAETSKPQQLYLRSVHEFWLKLAVEVQKQMLTKSPPSQSSPWVSPLVRQISSQKQLLLLQLILYLSMLLLVSVMSLSVLAELIQQSVTVVLQQPPTEVPSLLITRTSQVDREVRVMNLIPIHAKLLNPTLRMQPGMFTPPDVGVQEILPFSPKVTGIYYSSSQVEHIDTARARTSKRERIIVQQQQYVASQKCEHNQSLKTFFMKLMNLVAQISGSTLLTSLRKRVLNLFSAFFFWLYSCRQSMMIHSIMILSLMHMQFLLCFVFVYLSSLKLIRREQSMMYFDCRKFASRINIFINFCLTSRLISLNSSTYLLLIKFSSLPNLNSWKSYGHRFLTSVCPLRSYMAIISSKLGRRQGMSRNTSVCLQFCFTLQTTNTRQMSTRQVSACCLYLHKSCLIYTYLLSVSSSMSLMQYFLFFDTFIQELLLPSSSVGNDMQFQNYETISASCTHGYSYCSYCSNIQLIMQVYVVFVPTNVQVNYRL